MAKYTKYNSKKPGNKRSNQNNNSGRPQKKEDSKPVGNKKDVFPTNDISWWNKATQIFEDATRVPFNRISGAVFNVKETLPHFNDTYKLAPNPYEAKSGIMRIMYYPVLGPSLNLNSPVNRCMTSLYAGLYSKTTGAMQFTQADMALEILATDSIVQNIGLIKRALGLSNIYSGQNMYMPRALMTAAGINPDTVIGYQDEIRRRVNMLIQSLNALKLPGYLDIWKRHYQLTTNIYADEDDVRSQFYCFYPLGYYMYRDADRTSEISEVSHLEFIAFSTANGYVLDAGDLLDIIEEQILAIRHSSAFALVSGSMQRAYPDADMLMLSEAGLEDLCIPHYDRNMLWQINNATLTGVLPNEALHMTQDPVKDALIQDVNVDYSADRPVSTIASLASKHILNSYDGNVTPEFIMEGTRLMSMAEVEDRSFKDDTQVIRFKSFGTEICADAYIYRYVNTVSETGVIKTEKYQLERTLLESAMFVNGVDNFKKFINRLTTISRFKHHPRYVLISSSEDKTMSDWMGDLYVWTTVDRQTLEGLNEAALQSVYLVNLPNVIK